MKIVKNSLHSNFLSFFTSSSFLIPLFTLLSFVTNAQNLNHFFSEVSTAEAQLNSREKKLMMNVQSAKYNKSVKVVKMKKLKDALIKDVLTIPIQGEDILAQSEQFEYRDKDDFTWSGKLKNHSGYILIVSKPEGNMGAIQYDDKFFFIQPLKNDFCMLVEHDVAKYEPLGCSLGQDIGKIPLQTRSVSTFIQDGCALTDGTTCSATIDILILISTEARTWINTNLDYWGQVFYVPFLQAYTNLAFQNSGIPNKQVRIRTLDFNFTTSSNISNDLVQLRTNSSVNSIRDQYKADIVIGFTNKSYFVSGGQVFGEAATQNVESDKAYAIVEIPFALQGRWTFAHEMAHILGATHNRSSNGGNGNTNVCGHGFQFVDGSGITQRTIMAANTNPNTRILHFSNPSVLFNSTATGTNAAGQEADNARMIRNTGCMVSDFRPSPELSAFISSSGDVCTGMLVSAIVTPPAPGIPAGQGPYLFEWFLTTSAYFDPSNLIGTDQTITVNDPGLAIFWLHVRITASDGSTLVITRRFTSYCNYLIDNTTNMVEKRNSSLNISPNPSNGIYQAEVDITDETGNTRIEVTDINGKTVKMIKNQILQKGLYYYKIDLSDISNGMYILKLQNTQQNNIVKIIKN